MNGQLPLDVKLMNLATAAALAAFGLLLLWALGGWALRHPRFAVAGITVQGDVNHNSAATLRANVAPRLAGNFFTLDLQAARQAFEAVPWVRHAVVRRQFPNRLRVVLQEHRPVALWGAEGESRMVNSFGEVFEANVGEVESDGLPRLSGPAAEAGHAWALYQLLVPLFEPLELSIENLTLGARGGWSLHLDNGAELELGRGTADEVATRVARFTRTLSQAAARYGRKPDALVSADLRHADGYALRLRGVSTTDGDVQKKER